MDDKRNMKRGIIAIVIAAIVLALLALVIVKCLDNPAVFIPRTRPILPPVLPPRIPPIRFWM